MSPERREYLRQYAVERWQETKATPVLLDYAREVNRQQQRVRRRGLWFERQAAALRWVAAGELA